MVKKISLKKSLSVFLILILGGILGAVIYTYQGLQQINRVPLPQNNEELGIKPQAVAQSDGDIRNIALFGIDTGRDPKDPPHSDSIIIVTIDKLRDKLKLTSILRDSYVEVDGHKKTKITEAYTYGGPSLAIKTLNQNFDLDIKEYVTVDFFGLAKIIDTLGGVDMDIERKEVEEVNKWIKELAGLQKVKAKYISRSGLQKLNGIQAVAYSRIRKIGDGEFERTLRQRKVLNELLTNIKEVGIARLPSLIWEITPYVETNISSNDMITSGTSLLVSSMDSIEQQRFPIDGYCKGTIISGVWYLSMKPNIETTARQLSDYIYKDIKPLPKDPLF